MPDKININEELQLVSIISYGKVTSDEIGESIDTIAKLFREKKINKVLVDTTKQKDVPNIGSLYYLSKRIPHGLKIAIVMSTEQVTFEDLKFFETTSINKGKLMKVFKSIKDAENWLFY